MARIPVPPTGDEVAWVAEHLGHLTSDGRPVARGSIGGGQTAADAALAAFDVRGYASRRNEVLPVERRGASGLSPYVRHGLLQLRRMWDHVGGGPARDAAKFRDELLWQEYGRHLYARLGAATAHPLRALPPPPPPPPPPPSTGDGAEPLPAAMACMAAVTSWLEDDGWLVNQTRMWVASQWTVRHGADWREGEDWFFRHLLDGSRAANRLGWQWTVGTATGRPYGFGRWQVRTRAAELCDRCELAARCPIEEPPAERPTTWLAEPATGLLRGPSGGGPEAAAVDGTPDAVWVTAESLGDDDPALRAWPHLPAVFVFDEPLLTRLRLSGKRLVFLAECLADLARRRDVEVHLGDPTVLLAGRPLAATHAPVPGWRRRAARLRVVAEHPWPWLVRPDEGSLRSFSAWAARARRRVDR